jgi:hypothetical protein
MTIDFDDAHDGKEKEVFDIHYANLFVDGKTLGFDEDEEEKETCYMTVFRSVNGD